MMKFQQFGEDKIERDMPIIFWTREFWKIRAFDYNQPIILIMYTNARFHSIGTKLYEWQNFWKNKH